MAEMDLSRNSKLIFLILVGIFGIVLIIAAVFHNHSQNSEPDVKLTFEPKVDSESDLIFVPSESQNGNSTLGNRLSEILQGYEINNDKHPPVYCQHGGSSANKTQTCKIDTTNLHESCTASNQNFGYEGSAPIPCIMIQMKTAKGWVPESYLNHKDLDVALKQGLPLPLHNQIEAILNVSSSDPRLNTTWMLCEGEGPTDKENIGIVEYYSPAFSNGPFPGFPNYYFPFQNQHNYKVPFIFVRFPNLRRRVLVAVKCRVYAKNLEQKHSIRFEMMVD